MLGCDDKRRVGMSGTGTAFPALMSRTLGGIFVSPGANDQADFGCASFQMLGVRLLSGAALEGISALTDLAQADWHIAAVQSHIKRQGFRVEHVLDTGQSSIP
jgi:hypothetical protein